MLESSEETSIRIRKTAWGLFGGLFTFGAVMQASYGKIVEPVFFGLFAVAAFTMRWLTGKWWAEL